MSRNSEKAQSLLHRYLRQQSGLPQERPKRVQNAATLQDAERFRNMCLKEISMKVSRIHDILVSDFQIRDLNDELNKLMKEKRAWDYRVKELGGPDYISRPQSETGVAKDSRGYRYFGRAKELPDVKKLLEGQKEQEIEGNKRKMKRFNELNEMRHTLGLSKKLSSSYFGDNDSVGKDTYFVSLYPSVDMIVEQATSTLGTIALPSNLLMDGELFDLNKQFLDEQINSSSDLPLEKYERRTTRKIAKRNENLVDQGPLISIDEFNAPSSSEIEALIVQKRKEELLQRLKSRQTSG